MKPTYEKEKNISIQLAKQASAEILKIYYGPINPNRKQDGTLVTEADILSNKIILAGLQTAFPQDSIVSEELEDITGKNRRTWYIDPIDGTSGFTERSDQFAIHIGLAEERGPVFGLVYKPTTQEYFYACKGKGAYRVMPNGLEMKISPVHHSTQEELTLVINDKFLTTQNYLNLFDKINPDNVIISGSEGLRIIKIAEGIGDVHLVNNYTKLNTWDLCAPQIIAEEAGAYVRFIDGTEIEYFGQRKIGKDFIIARTKELGEKVAKLVKQHTPNYEPVSK